MTFAFKKTKNVTYYYIELVVTHAHGVQIYASTKSVSHKAFANSHEINGQSFRFISFSLGKYSPMGNSFKPLVKDHAVLRAKKTDGGHFVEQGI